MANLFLNHWITPSGIPAYLLKDNGPHFVSMFFQSVRRTLLMMCLVPNSYRPESSRQVERFNKTIITHLKQYVTEHQRNWAKFVQPLIYMYNTELDRSTITSPYILALSRQLPGLLLFAARMNMPDGSSDATLLQAMRAENSYES